MGSTPRQEQAENPALIEHKYVLGDLGQVVCEAWESFDASLTSELRIVYEEATERTDGNLDENGRGDHAKE